MLTPWTVPRVWPGETVFIVGGGPSLRGFDPERLRGRRVIVINRMVLAVDQERRTIVQPGFDPEHLLWPGIPWADVLYFCDRNWWATDGAAVRKVWRGSYIVTVARVDEPGVHRVNSTGAGGLEQLPTGVRSGTNSGYQAINLAYHFGVKRIVLLGFDQKVTGGETHAHGGYRGPAVDAPSYLANMDHVLTNRMLPYFSRLVDPLKAAGVEVLNANPESALDCWPRVTLQEAL